MPLNSPLESTQTYGAGQQQRPDNSSDLDIYQRIKKTMPQKNNNTLLCEPHDGSRGTSFTRTWLPMFLMHLVGIIDDSGECLAANVDETDEGSQKSVTSQRLDRGSTRSEQKGMREQPAKRRRRNMEHETNMGPRKRRQTWKYKFVQYGGMWVWIACECMQQ